VKSIQRLAAAAALALLAGAPATTIGAPAGPHTLDLPRWQCTAIGQTGSHEDPAAQSYRLDGHAKSEARAAALASCRQDRARHCHIERCAKL